MKLKFYQDAGHGWIQVPHKTILSMPEKLIEKITKYSYMDKTHVYLEEDCDAYLFMSWLSDIGVKPTLETVYHDHSPVRSKDRFSRGDLE